MQEELSPVLQSFHSDFERLKLSFQTIAQRILNEGLSEYPIFIASSLPCKLGIPIYSPEQHGTRWYFYVSFIEELAKKEVIRKERLNAFYHTYKEPEYFACFFLMLPEEASFIFVPYTHLS